MGFLIATKCIIPRTSDTLQKQTDIDFSDDSICCCEEILRKTGKILDYKVLLSILVKETFFGSSFLIDTHDRKSFL